jgi:hypothetical protein
MTQICAGYVPISYCAYISVLFGSHSQESNWIVFDGTSEKRSKTPASEDPDLMTTINLQKSSTDVTVTRYSLHGIISEISEQLETDMKSVSRHHVLHLRNGARVNEADIRKEWHLLNDFVISRTSVFNVVQFPNFRHPELLYYQRISGSGAPANDNSLIPLPGSSGVTPRPALPQSVPEVRIPGTVFALPSLSGIPCTVVASLPKAGDLVAIDGEVSLDFRLDYFNDMGVL